MLVFVYYSDWFDFYVFALMHWLSWEPLCGPVFVCFCIKSSIGTQGGVSWLWKCFRSPGGLLCWPLWGDGPGIGLVLCCFVVYSTRRFVLCLTFCNFVLVFFGPFGVAISSLGEGRAGLDVFRALVRFVLVWICRFPLPLGVWEGLRDVIVALPGLFSYLFRREKIKIIGVK